MAIALERLNDAIETLQDLVIDAAEDKDGGFLGHPRAFAYACDLIYTRSDREGVRFLFGSELDNASPEEIDKMVKVVEACIVDQQR